VTLAQANAIALLLRHGSLQRYPGGFWSAPNQRAPTPWTCGGVATPVIQALAAQGLVEIRAGEPAFVWPTNQLIAALEPAAC